MKLILLILSFCVCLAIGRDIANKNEITTKSDSDVEVKGIATVEEKREINEEIIPKIKSILSDHEFEKFEKSLKFVNNVKCKKDLNTTLWGLKNALPWAVSMYDSTVKAPVGIESGSVYQFGQFDECVNVDKHEQFTSSPLSSREFVGTKYCLADVTVEGFSVKRAASRKHVPKDFTIVHWGVCVPASCGSSDVAVLMENLLDHRVTVDEKMCHIRKDLNPTSGMFIYACIIMCFVSMAIVSTLYHAYLLVSRRNSQKDECFEAAMKAFSVIENLQKLTQASKDQLGLNSINGIKAIAMILIITGHSLVFIYGGPVANTDFMEEDIKRVQNAFLTNSLLFVDAFLLLSGFLFCRILLIELERRRGRLNVLILYIARYIRLTPAYLAVLAFYITWFPSIGSGPMWNSRIVTEQERCSETWWLNILYINNYFKTDNLCMFQSWYLSVDSQLFILAPIVIYLLYKSRKAGVGFLTALTIVALIVPFVITHLNKLDPTLMVFPDEVTDFASNEFYVTSYIKTHMRASGYIYGLITGFVVHLIQEKNFKIPSSWVRTFWVFSTIIGIGSMYGITVFYSRPFTSLESTIYAGFHKIGWSLSVSWLVIAVTTGHATVLQKFLSARIFAPLSRLTYCAYLTNGLVELYHAGAIRNPTYMSRINMVDASLSHIFDTFLLALVLCLLFESPIHALERALLRRDRKKVSQNENQKTESITPSTSEENFA